MKSAILATLFPFAAIAAALTPDTIKDDIPGDATIREIVTAGGGGGGSGVDTNAVRDIIHATVDGAARPLPRYLHERSFDDSYPDDAAEYYRSRGDGKTDGGCSAVRDGGCLSRNFDYPFDERAEFVVKMSAGAGRFASVGVAQVGTNLTEQIVTSGKPSRCYKWLPGATVDGINENGVVAEINVVDTPVTGWHTNATDKAIHPLAAVRWVLDNATNAQSAAEYIAANIRFPKGWEQNFHYMVADEASTYIVENGTATDGDEYHEPAEPVTMTNFQLSKFPWDGMGMERFGLLLGGANITNAWFTNAYRRETNPPWVSDLSDVLAYTNDIFNAWAAHDKEYFRNKMNGGQPWWQTVHTSVYDIENRTLRVAVQETDDWYVFAIAKGGGDVKSVNGKTGDVVLGAADVGAIPDSTTHLSGDVPVTRKINGKQLTDDVTISAADVGAVPSTGGTFTGNVTFSRDATATFSGYNGGISLGNQSSVRLNGDSSIEVDSGSINLYEDGMMNVYGPIFVDDANGEIDVANGGSVNIEGSGELNVKSGAIATFTGANTELRVTGNAKLSVMANGKVKVSGERAMSDYGITNRFDEAGAAESVRTELNADVADLNARITGSTQRIERISGPTGSISYDGSVKVQDDSLLGDFDFIDHGYRFYTRPEFKNGEWKSFAIIGPDGSGHQMVVSSFSEDGTEMIAKDEDDATYSVTLRRTSVAALTDAPNLVNGPSTNLVSMAGDRMITGDGSVWVRTNSTAKSFLAVSFHPHGSEEYDYSGMVFSPVGDRVWRTPYVQDWGCTFELRYADGVWGYAEDFYSPEFLTDKTPGPFEFREFCLVNQLSHKTNLVLRPIGGSWVREGGIVKDTTRINGIPLTGDVEIPSGTNTNDVREIVYSTTTNLFRTFGDEYVYEPDGFSDFTWSGSRADAVAAIGTTQPTVDYEAGGFTQWSVGFEMNGHYYWGYAYDRSTQPSVPFDFYTDYYDEQRGEWVYDEFQLYGTRRVTGYHRSNPTDTFARQSELTAVNTGVTQLRNRIDGETKVMRTGLPGERGTGWGYMQSSLDSDYRQWRMRVPQWTNVTGTNANNAAVSQTYVSWTNGNQRSVGYAVFIQNPMSWLSGWDFERTVRETRGAYGNDAVQEADYDIGISLRGLSGNAHFMNYVVTQTSQTPAFRVTLNTVGWTPTNRIYVVGSGSSAVRVTVPGYFRPIGEHLSRTWTYASGSGYTDRASVEMDIGGLFISDFAYDTTRGVSFTFNAVCENEHVSVIRELDGGGESTLLDESLHDTFHGYTIQAACNSNTTFENVFAPYYKVVGSIDAGLFYDAALDVTFRISVTNGCFYSEKYCDGDWR